MRKMNCANCGKEVEVMEQPGEHCLEVLCGKECIDDYNAKLDAEDEEQIKGEVDGL